MFTRMASQTRNTGLKTSAYFWVRSIDECLNRALLGSTGLDDLTAYRLWVLSRVGESGGKSGGFNISRREIQACLSRERFILHKNEEQPRIVRGPDGGPEEFTKVVLQMYKTLTDIVNGKKPLTSIFPQEVTQWVYWNDKTQPDAPKDEAKGKDTYAFPILRDWTKESIAENINWLKDNLTKESMIEYKYNPPVSNRS